MTKDDFAVIIPALEDAMAQANIKGDGEYYRTHLADEALAVASFGVFDKATIVQQVSENRNPFTAMRLEDMRVLPLGDVSALVTYKMHIEAARDGQPFTFSVYATTVWRRDGEQWLADTLDGAGSAARR